MTAALRLVDTGLSGARWNVALTAALAELHGAGRIPDTLRLHRYPVSVLLGRSQPLSAGLLAAAARRGAEIARRVTGGGAVAMGPGVIAWDLVVPRNAWPSLDAAARAVGEALAGALGALGLAARFRPPGDILVGARKVAGTSGLFDGPTLLHQGSLLVDADIAGMAELLGQPGLPVTSLVELGAPPVPWIADAIAAALGRHLRPAPPGEAELALAEKLLAEEIGSEAFVAGEAAPEPALHASDDRSALPEIALALPAPPPRVTRAAAARREGREAAAPGGRAAAARAKRPGRDGVTGASEDPCRVLWPESVP